MPDFPCHKIWKGKEVTNTIALQSIFDLLRFFFLRLHIQFFEIIMLGKTQFYCTSRSVSFCNSHYTTKLFRHKWAIRTNVFKAFESCEITMKYKCPKNIFPQDFSFPFKLLNSNFHLNAPHDVNITSASRKLISFHSVHFISHHSTNPYFSLWNSNKTRN